MKASDLKKVPIYLQIRESIYNKIVNGEYRAGDKLPSEDKLAETFGVSRMTVNKALMELVNQEYLVRTQGSGTFVSKVRKEGSKKSVMGFNASMESKGFLVNTNVLIQEMMLPGREISAKLNLPVTQEVLHLKRIRNVNNEPIVLQESYVFAQGIEKVSTVDLRNQSLYKCLEEMCDEKIVKAHDVIEAIAAKGELCEALQKEEGFPVLSTSRLAYGKSGNPVELTYSLYRSDQYEVELEYATE